MGILSGPRGRYFTLAWLFGQETGRAQELRSKVFDLAYRLDPGRGTSRVQFTVGGEPQTPRELTTSASIVQVLGKTETPGVTGAGLREALIGTVDSARYWQPPSGEDVLLEIESIVQALSRFASVLESHEATSWLKEPMARNQYYVRFEDGLDDEDFPKYLDRWQSDIERQQREFENDGDPWSVSGTWWSTPPTLSTSRADLSGIPQGLYLIEDSLGWDRATVSQLTSQPSRIYEIDSPQAWIELCRSYPIDVTYVMAGTWYQTTGSKGPWVIPNWTAVATDYDAVHLTGAAYLEAAGRVLEVTDSQKTMIAGWAPDVTYWLTSFQAGMPHRYKLDRDADYWVEI